jgi:hypothetical protein
LGRDEESARLAGALFASDLISGDALTIRPGLKLVRVGLHAVAGDNDSAIYELKRIDPNNAPVAISVLSLPVDDLPIFAALTDEEPFRKFAATSRYRIAQQARMLASGETAKEIQLQVEMAGYTLGDWR